MFIRTRFVQLLEAWWPQRSRLSQLLGHHLCYLHLQGGRRRQEGSRAPSPAHRTGHCHRTLLPLLLMLTCEAGKTGKLVLSPTDRCLLSNCTDSVSHHSPEHRGSHPHTADEEMGCLSPPRSSLAAPASPSLSVTAESTPSSHFTPHPHLSRPGLIWGSLVWGHSWADFSGSGTSWQGCFSSPTQPTETPGQRDRPRDTPKFKSRVMSC